VFIPKIVTTLRHYSRAQFRDDAIAGVVVGIVALPLAIAFAIASGLGPERGLYTAIIAGFLISALGGSRVQIGGPTGAFVVIVYGVVTNHGLDGLLAATLLAGIILIGFGVAQIGAALKFIPHPVVAGFTSGIAVVILLSQVRDFFGLEVGAVPAEFIEKVEVLAEHAGSANPWAVVVATGTVLVLRFWPRIERRIPAPFVALVLATAAVHVFALPVETIGSRFGEINASFPAPSLPRVSLTTFRDIVGPAFAIALLAGIESLLSAVVADGMMGGRHRSNMELIAQGVANIGTSLFGGMPATGALARTATNIRSGGRTPVAGIVHALTLLVITLFFGKWAALIPMPALAGILVIVAYGMSEWRGFRRGLRAPRSDAAVLLLTFALTVFIDLTVALAVGVIVSAFLFLRRMAELTSVEAVTTQFRDSEDPNGLLPRRSLPAGVEIYEIDGPFFFGAADTFKETLGNLGAAPRALIIRMRAVPTIDATGLVLLEDLAKRSRAGGTALILTELQSQPRRALERQGILTLGGAGQVVATLDDAIALAARITAPVPVPPKP
jgi:SulP family sulfate permease